MNKKYLHIDADGIKTSGVFVRWEAIWKTNYPVIKSEDGQEWICTGVYFEDTPLLRSVLERISTKELYNIIVLYNSR